MNKACEWFNVHASPGLRTTRVRQMSSPELTSLEQAAVSAALERFSQQDRLETIPFSLFIVSVPAARECSLAPKIPDRLRRSIRERIRGPSLSVETVGEILNDLRAQMIPMVSELRLKAVICPDIPPPDASKPPGSLPEREECCLAEPKVGCDSDSGKTYLAKTDGFTVWFSTGLFASENRNARADGPLGSRSISYSAMMSVLLHEFGHVMHVTPQTAQIFGDLEIFYWEAAELVPIDLRRSGRIRVSHADMLEFVASSFAAENARVDAGNREECD